MKLDVNIIASSSKGNCIVISDGVSKLLLDAGLSYPKLARHVKLSEIEAVLITHEHQDHSKASVEMVRRGMDVYMSYGSFSAIKGQQIGCKLVESLDQFETENWYILPFEVEHDAAEPLGFMVESKNSGAKAVYIVDSSFIDYDFSGITHWIIEANYDEQILTDGDHEEWLKDRIRKTHFSLDGLKRFLGSSDLSKTEEIYLVHLSDSNSHEKNFIQEIEALTGVPVYTDSSMYPEKANVVTPSP